jgi:hypothetical protein
LQGLGIIAAELLLAVNSAFLAGMALDLTLRLVTGSFIGGFVHWPAIKHAAFKERLSASKAPVNLTRRQ